MPGKTARVPCTLTELERVRELYRSGGIGTTLVRFTAPQKMSLSTFVDELELINFTDQVRKGCILLDAITPGWMDRIDVEALDLWDTTSCVLGQAYTENELGIPGYDFEVKTYLDEFNLDPADYGFNMTNAQLNWADGLALVKGWSTSKVSSLVWEHLTNTWTQTIKERRAAALQREASSLG